MGLFKRKPKPNPINVELLRVAKALVETLPERSRNYGNLKTRALVVIHKAEKELGI